MAEFIAYVFCPPLPRANLTRRSYSLAMTHGCDGKVDAIRDWISTKYPDRIKACGKRTHGDDRTWEQSLSSASVSVSH